MITALALGVVYQSGFDEEFTNFHVRIVFPLNSAGKELKNVYGISSNILMCLVVSYFSFKELRINGDNNGAQAH